MNNGKIAMIIINPTRSAGFIHLTLAGEVCTGVIWGSRLLDMI
jgi:hypothetical protein